MLCSIQGGDANILTQVPALREAFAALGHQHTPVYDDPDTAFVFVGNGPYEPYLELAASRAKKTIFNVLDCPTWCVEWPEFAAKWPAQLAAADRVTCISKTVQADLKNLLGIDAEVIYYPMKAVRHTGGKRYPQFRVAMVGRLRDSSKRAGVAVQALIRAGFNEDEVAIIGPEYLGWGVKMGVVSDEVLNDIYNSVDYVMMTSLNEGLGLPALEAACCGAIPIVCRDLSVFSEFWAQSPLGLHYGLLNSPAAIASLIRALEADPKWKTEVKQDMLGYAELAFRPKLDRIEVAKRIINIYQSI